MFTAAGETFGTAGKTYGAAGGTFGVAGGIYGGGFGAPGRTRGAAGGIPGGTAGAALFSADRLGLENIAVSLIGVPNGSGADAAGFGGSGIGGA